MQLDAAYRKINLKGTRPENMPRYSKKRSNGSAYSGISHHKVCIVSAIDSQDNIFLNIVGLGVKTFEKYKDCKYKFDDIRQTKAYKEEELVYAELPISLKDAYNEYRYGTFA